MTLSFGGRMVLNDADLEVLTGASAAVTGPSGAGKSTLLSCILGLVRLDQGHITVDGESVTFGASDKMSRLRREKIGVVFQTGELLPELTPGENVTLAGLLAGMRPNDARERSAHLLSELGVPDADRSVTEFSGGERQRVAVARALMNQPSVVLADEPTGSLDPASRSQVLDMLFALPGQFGCALVVVTHDPVVAERADRQLQLSAGRLLDNSAAVGSME